MYEIFILNTNFDFKNDIAKRIINIQFSWYNYIYVCKYPFMYMQIGFSVQLRDSQIMLAHQKERKRSR